MIRCACPHCRQFLTAPDDRAGKRGRCPVCKGQFILGQPPAPPALSDVLPAPRRRPAWVVPLLAVALPLAAMSLLCCGVLGLGGLSVLGRQASRGAAARNPMSVAAYKATRPREPQTFTLDCELTTSRYGPTWLETRYAARLHDNNYDSLYGEVAKDSAAGRALFEALKDGREHRLRVVIRPAEDADGSADFVDILEVLP
jgi:hypothetical protein